MGGEEVAIKISRSSKMDIDNSKKEAQILERLKMRDPADRFGCVKIKDAFMFRKHVVIITELLSQNLYKILHAENFKGLNKEPLKKVANQLLNSLIFIKKAGIIHCDLKPENMMFSDKA